jgi:predicted RND superfamily exporter protein
MNVEQAVRVNLGTAGQGMIITRLVLALGLFVFTLSGFADLPHFGLLTGTCVLLALAADFL